MSVGKKNRTFPLGWVLGKIAVEEKKVSPDFAHLCLRSKEVFMSQIYKEGRLMSGFS